MNTVTSTHVALATCLLLLQSVAACTGHSWNLRFGHAGPGRAFVTGAGAETELQRNGGMTMIYKLKAAIRQWRLDRAIARADRARIEHALYTPWRYQFRRDQVAPR